MSRKNENCQIISISGLDTQALIHKLHYTKTNENVKTLVMHVGVVNCKNGYTVTKRIWQEIGDAAKKCFPNASISFSSILPLKNEPV